MVIISLGNEDFTGYTEVDTGPAMITVAASRVSFTGIDRAHDGYVYKDYGTDYFGNFTHDATINITKNKTESIAYFMGVSSTVTSYLYWAKGISVYFYVNNTFNNLDIILRDKAGYNDTYIKTNIILTALGEFFYPVLTRVDNVCTLVIYMDAAHSIVTDTLSITCLTDKYRYSYACSSSNEDGTTPLFNGYIENLDLYKVADVSSYFKITSSSTVVYLYDPESVSFNDGKDVIVLNFWSNENVAYDTGKNAERITINGSLPYQNVFSADTIYSSFDLISELDALMENDEEITITNFPIEYVNTTWVVEEFSYNVNTGSPGNINYSLTLEKT